MRRCPGIAIILTSLCLSACKIEITVPETGQVLAESGNYSCAAGSTCLVEISDIFFDETFVGEPASGYEFVQWERVHLGACGGSTKPCRLFTSFAAANADLIAAIESDLLLTLRPVFALQPEPPEDPGDPLVKLGEALFFNETFDGNGRTCGTCHPAENNFTIDPAFIAALPQEDPLFVAETNPDLASLEDSSALRQFGLIRANADGFENPTEKFVLRSVPHLLGLASSLASNRTEAPLEMTGWSGDGAPGAGTLRDFSTGAVVQHFTRTLARVEGVDFRLPTNEELDALEAFMLSLGTPATMDLQALRLTDPNAEAGRKLFITEDSENGSKKAGKCNICHRNAGALTVDGINQNFDTAVEDLQHPADVYGILRPRDGGLGTWFNQDTGGYGDGTFNSVPLVHAADTAPFFHNNRAGSLEEAISHYELFAFKVSPEGRRLQLEDSGGRELSVDVEELAAFLRVINMLENIRSSVDYLSRARTYVTSTGIQTMLSRALYDLDDVTRVRTEGMLHAEVASSIANAKAQVALAMAEPAANVTRRNGFIDLAIVAALGARDMMASVLPPPVTQ